MADEEEIWECEHCGSTPAFTYLDETLCFRCSGLHKDYEDKD